MAVLVMRSANGVLKSIYIPYHLVFIPKEPYKNEEPEHLVTECRSGDLEAKTWILKAPFQSKTPSPGAENGTRLLVRPIVW